MRGLPVALVGGLVIALAIAGLVEHKHRAGPWDAPLEAAPVPFTFTGSYHARPWTEPTLGLCPQEPCAPRTEVQLRILGLPDLAFGARFGGPDGQSLGALRRDGDAAVLAWQADQDHQGERAIAIVLAGRQVAAIGVGPSVEPMALRGDASASWGAAPAIVHLNEIGGVTISTVAKAELEAPPAGWTHHAWFEGDGGVRALGEVENGVLDARLERVGLERQDRLVVSMHPVGAEPAAPEEGFPVWTAALPP